jgi:hypothetical protein
MPKIESSAAYILLGYRSSRLHFHEPLLFIRQIRLADADQPPQQLYDTEFLDHITAAETEL